MTEDAATPPTPEDLPLIKKTMRQLALVATLLPVMRSISETFPALDGFINAARLVAPPADIVKLLESKDRFDKAASEVLKHISDILTAAGIDGDAARNTDPKATESNDGTA